MKRNPAAFGLTLQKIICEEYDVKCNEYAKKQFNSNYDSNYNNVKFILPNIFKEIQSFPVKCVTYEYDDKDGYTFSPHNFYLSNGLTLSIKTSLKKRAFVAPQIVGQAGFDTLNYHFGHLYDAKIANQNDIKKMVWSRIDDMIPVFIDYLFLSDILVWVYIDKDVYKYKIIYRNEKPNFGWEKDKITFTKNNILLWNECLTVKYNNISIAQVQVHKKRSFKFRFDLNNLIQLLNKKEQTNETFGVSVENNICEIFNLDRPDHLLKRADSTLINETKDIITKAFEELPKPIKYVGAEKGERGGQSKSPFDFILDGNKTLSVKTNTGNKVCPPEIGQPSIETFKNHFGYLIDNLDSFDANDFKRIAIFDTAELMTKYLDFLFDCDYLLWIYKNKDKYEFRVLSEHNDFSFKQSKFTFTQTLDKWKESNTVKYNEITIGEFQVHKNRNSLKFRFDMPNLIKLLEENG